MYFLNFFQHCVRIYTDFFPCMDFFPVDIRSLFSVLLLPKVPIVLTNALNKNCIKLNFPMGKNFGNWHATITFFMRSVLILTLTGVNKGQFLKSYTILLYNSWKIVTFAPVGYWYRYPTVALRITLTLTDDWFRYTTGVKVSRLRLLWTKSVID